MGDVYIPGVWSQRYMNLPAAVRANVDQEVNRLFRERTGITRTLDPKRDHDLANRWLRIRDEVMEQTAGKGLPDTRTPPKPSCPNDFSKSFEIEARAASRTRHQSIEVASRFVRTVGAVGRTGRFIPTIIDTKYWFAKLYEITTGFEISAARDYKEPGFVLHFIPIFYNMYNQALDSWGAGGGAVSPLWRAHFMSTGRPDNDSILGWSNGVVASLVTGVNAHIRGDMGQALETAYRLFVTKYCLDPAPPFDTYKPDFFAMGTVFNQARTAAMSLVASLGPIPEAGVKVGDALGAGLDVSQVNQWRAEAWAEAKRRLGQ
ncbi:DUF5995 family protein [Prosthecomicrobium sp. N25]|uniref:DUF5995 family protein n=1 Tax=Prosthecomicrobium sp. N25 TaxID=3129254 RepID=UPI003077C663